MKAWLAPCSCVAVLSQSCSTTSILDTSFSFQCGRSLCENKRSSFRDCPMKRRGLKVSCLVTRCSPEGDVCSTVVWTHRVRKENIIATQVLESKHARISGGWSVHQIKKKTAHRVQGEGIKSLVLFCTRVCLSHCFDVFCSK